jgi:hypothetical protein
MVHWWPEQGVRHLALIGCARGLDAQAESWRLQGHVDSGCQKEAQFVLKRVACPGLRVGSTVKSAMSCLSCLAASPLATSQLPGQHDTGRGYSLCRQFLEHAASAKAMGTTAKVSLILVKVCLLY